MYGSGSTLVAFFCTAQMDIHFSVNFITLSLFAQLLRINERLFGILSLRQPSYANIDLVAENVSRVDYTVSTSPSVGGWKDAFLRKVGRSASGDKCASMTKRSPLSIRKGSQNNLQDHLYSRADDWHVEISVPKNRIAPVETLHEESEGSCVTKSFEGKNDNATPRQVNNNYGYDQLDDNPEYSATSELVNTSFETKHVTVAPDCLEEGNSVNLSRPKHRFRADMDLRTDIYLDSTKEYKSIMPGVFCGCPASSGGELALIRKQLLDIERKQSSLMDLMQVRYFQGYFLYPVFGCWLTNRVTLLCR